MKINLDPAAEVPRHITAESEALGAWYDDHPDVRRLWAIRTEQVLNVIITLEPTVDNADTYPSWFAFNHRWSREIQSIAGGPVRLELLDEPVVSEFEIDLEGEIVAALSWRDPTSFWKAD